MPAPTLAAVIAAQLPDDCPQDVLLPAQRDYVLRMLQIAYTQADNEVNNKRDMALPCGPQAAHRSNVQNAIENVERAGFASLVHYLSIFLPPGFDASRGLFTITHETRKEWAKKQAKAHLLKCPEWCDVAPDILDDFCQDISEAWYAGLKQRLCEYRCIADYDLLVDRMNQDVLYKWILDNKPSWVINRYRHSLTEPYQKKLEAKFNKAQWFEITCWVGHLPDVITFADAAAGARFERALAEQVG